MFATSESSCSCERAQTSAESVEIEFMCRSSRIGAPRRSSRRASSSERTTFVGSCSGSITVKEARSFAIASRLATFAVSTVSEPITSFRRASRSRSRASIVAMAALAQRSSLQFFLPRSRGSSRSHLSSRAPDETSWSFLLWMRTIALLVVAAVSFTDAFVVTPAPRLNTAVAVSRSAAPEMVVF